MSAELNTEYLLKRILEAVQEKTTHHEYVQRLIGEDVRRKAEAKAFAEAEQIIGWRELACRALRAAEDYGADVSRLWDWKEDLSQYRTNEEWQSLAETINPKFP